MAQITTADIQGLIALAITNNKAGLIQAMNQTGNTVSNNISDDDLLQKVWDVFNSQGLPALKNVFNKVLLNKSALTPSQQNVLIQKFSIPVNTAAKCSLTNPLDCVTGPVNYVGDLLGGHSTTNAVQPTINTNSTALISPSIVIAVVIVIVIFIVIIAFT